MRDRFPILVVGGLLLAGVLGWFLVQGARRGGFADQLSTFKSEPDGARALYLLLSETGVPVTRMQQDLQIIPPNRSLVMLGTRFERELGFDKIAIDGSDGGVDDERDAEADDAEFKQRGLNALRSPAITEKESDKLLEHIRNGATLVYVPASYRDPKLLEDLDVKSSRTSTTLDVRTLVPGQPSRYTQGVQRVVVKVRAFLELPPGAVPLLVDEKLEEPVAALLPYGQGRIIIIGAPELAMNRNIATADNAVFWHSLISTVASNGPVAFDEYHHGFTGERSMGEFAARYGLQYAVGQVILGLALWAMALRRFGRPKVPKEELRVGSTDALFATSRLYREGKHHAHAAQSIVRQLAAEFAAKAGVSSRSEPAEIGAALEVRGRKDLARALLDLAQAARSTNSEADVERVATLAALARKTLNHHRKEQIA
ncbi:MAG: hypothetical protein DI536_26380 [Archangium gephyra]|uniref:DUF4350 domain-containing protein n=1 Tax=Archangium gephyra TaxID=48 RepID=A0A2W5SY65_9BACT|nr:MAG: hypothetical protein DI536_26380 [Archangium gephyra]